MCSLTPLLSGKTEDLGIHRAEFLMLKHNDRTCSRTLLLVVEEGKLTAKKSTLFSKAKLKDFQPGADDVEEERKICRQTTRICF